MTTRQFNHLTHLIDDEIDKCETKLMNKHCMNIEKINEIKALKKDLLAIKKELKETFSA